MAVLSKLLVLSRRAAAPTAVLKLPVALSKSATVPTAVLELPLLRTSAPAPTPVLKLPSVLAKSERKPSAVFPAPVVLLMRASLPGNTLKRLLLQPSKQAARACGDNAKHVSVTATRAGRIVVFLD